VPTEWGEVMEKEIALKDAKERLERTLLSIDVAQKICDKVDPLLPAGWHSIFFGEQYLEFCPLYEHKASSAEFRTVCDLVEKATGKKLSRRASGTKDDPRLIASDYGHFENDAWLTLWVEQDADDTCKINFKRTWEIKPIADERCLGLSRMEVR